MSQNRRSSILAARESRRREVPPRARGSLSGLLATFALAALLGGSGCATVRYAGEPELNPENLPNASFWHVYRRGIHRMAGRRWAEAAEDMERCLGRRGGALFAYPFDLWRVRTYGLHVHEHYFPHRELGICRLEQGDAAAAMPLLEESLRQEPSARARHYLTLARTRWVVGRPLAEAALDATVVGGAHQSKGEFELEITATCAAFVSQVRVAGDTLTPDVAEREWRFRHRVRLPPGAHRMEVAARDLLGRETLERVDVVVDPVCPQFVFDRARREGAAWRLSGVCADEHGLQSVTLDNQPVPLENERATLARLEILVPDGREITLAAIDLAGNAMTTRLREEVLPRLLAQREHAPKREVWAAAGAAPPPAPEEARPGEKGATLTLDGMEGGASQTHEDHFFLSGTAYAPAGITRVNVGERDILVPGARMAGRLLRFGVFVPVATGTNVVRVAIDPERGPRTTETIRIVRRPAEFARPELRLAAAIPPVLNAEILREVALAQSELHMALVERPVPFEPRFQVLAQGQELLAALSELRLSLTDLVDDRARVPYRRWMDADLSLNGQVLREPDGFTVRVHTVLADSGEWIGADDIFLPAGATDIRAQFRGLAAMIERRFPSLVTQGDGPVGRTIELPAGREKGLRLGARFLLVRPGPDGRVRSGALVRAGALPVQVRVSRADPGRSAARFVTGGPDLVRPGDWWVAR